MFQKTDTEAEGRRDGSRLITGCTGTVGQRMKVTAVTFFPARPRLDQTTQIRAKYARFAWMKSRDVLCMERMWRDLSWVQIPVS